VSEVVFILSTLLHFSSSDATIPISHPRTSPPFIISIITTTASATTTNAN